MVSIAAAIVLERATDSEKTGAGAGPARNDLIAIRRSKAGVHPVHWHCLIGKFHLASLSSYGFRSKLLSW